jgi:CubicO group peptidase (beta-lactamase class C family)
MSLPTHPNPDLPLPEALDCLAEQTRFSGVVRVDRSGSIELANAYGFADRRHEILNTIETQFAIASGSKGLTALAVVSLIEKGTLHLTTSARSVLGADLPLIGDDVTIENLLSHRSGIGDYLDEDAGHQITDYVMPVPVHELASTEQYLAVLGGHPAAFRAGERFSYCNSGYVVLALIAERVAGISFHNLVRQRVCESAGMDDTGFLRSDELPSRAAVGYLAEPVSGRTSSICLSAGVGTAGSTPLRRISARCGAHSSTGEWCRWIGWPKWFGRAVTCLRIRDAMALASG